MRTAADIALGFFVRRFVLAFISTAARVRCPLITLSAISSLHSSQYIEPYRLVSLVYLVWSEERKKPNEPANQRDQINQPRQSRSAILVERHSIAPPFSGSSLQILSSIDHNGQRSLCRDSAIDRTQPDNTSNVD